MNERDSLKKLSAAIALAVSAMGTSLASAENTTPSGVDWQCVQKNDDFFQVLCVPKPTFGHAAAPEAAPIDSAEAPAFVKTTAPFTGGRDMRSVTERGLPEVFSATAWSIPLYSRPSDAAFVTRLLDAVLCETAPHCSVSYLSN
jgi:hypothetical protein